MNKKVDYFLNVFILLYEIILYSLAFPLFLGIVSLLTGLYGHLYLFIMISIIVGVCLKVWRDEKSSPKNSFRFPFHDNFIRWFKNSLKKDEPPYSSLR